MSEFAYSLNQSVPVIKKFQVGAASVANVGVPLLIAATGEAGVNVGSTTGTTDFVGMSLDTATYSTTQGTGTSSAEALVSINISPDSVWKANMSGGATEGTALSEQTNTTASSGGTVITTGAAWNSPTYLDGVAWGYSGANSGQFRKVTTVGATSGTVVVPFDNAIAVGDVFLRAPYFPCSTATVQLTTNLYEADASIAEGTGAAFAVVDLELRDSNREGTTRSKVYFVSNDHFFGGRA